MRRGVSVAVLVLIVLVLAGIGMALSTQARQAGRASHWSYHAQIAYNLADGALKEALLALSTANSAAAAKSAPVGAAALTAAFELVVRGAAGEVPLFDSSADVPNSLRSVLDDLVDFSPGFDVRLRVLASEPLWSGSLDGLPAVAGERKGRVQLIVRAHVRTHLGIQVDRTLVLEKGYKVVCPVPPLVGRFALFVQNAPAADVNAVPMKFDPDSGNAGYSTDVRPIEVQSSFKARAVAPGSWTLDRERFVSALPADKFLDGQGWIYLGASGNAKWSLHLAHGFAEGGETPLLRATEERTQFRGDAAADAGFTQRFRDLFNAFAKCIAYFPPAELDLGLYLAQHGWASNYELVSVREDRYGEVQGPGGERRRVNFGAGETASLRLFGSATSLSPTLVFGPAMREWIQRATILVIMGPPAFCFAPGKVRLHLYRLEEHIAAMRDILLGAFESRELFQTWGTCVRSEPFVRGLETLLSAKGSGEYAKDGLLGPAPFSAATPRSFSSDLLPWLGSLPQARGLPDAVMQKLVRGDLDAPAIFQGNLAGGLAAFEKAMNAKLTFVATPAALTRRLLVDGKLRVPGVVLVETAAPLELPAIAEVVEGGILMTRGPLRIRGNIVRKSQEPLTLVSLDGDIEVEPAAGTVDAYLVAPRGAVRLRGSTTVGGVACRDLDLSVITSPGNRTINHGPDTDPAGPQKALVRVYYGGEDRLAVSGMMR